MNLRAMNNRLPEQLLETEGLEVISTYDAVSAAHHAIDVLGDEGFPVQELRIKGNGLISIERVTGRLGYGKIALNGAFSGIYFGFGIALVALLTGIIDTSSLFNSLGACIIIGVGLGVLFAVLNFTFNRNKRGFASLTGITATRYDLLAPRAQIMRARKILADHASAAH